MIRTLFAGAAALALCGCSPISALMRPPGTTTNADVLQALGEHIEGCDRRYQGGLGIGASFSFTIDCKAQQPPRPEPTLSPEAPGSS